MDPAAGTLLKETVEQEGAVLRFFFVFWMFLVFVSDREKVFVFALKTNGLVRLD